MVLRFIAAVLLLVAVVAFVADITKPLTRGGPVTPMTIARQWQAYAPSSMAAAQKAVTRSTHHLVWEAVIVPTISLPIFVLFGALGVAAGYAGRRRHKVNIFAN